MATMSGDNLPKYLLRKGKGKVIIFVNDKLNDDHANFFPADVSKSWQGAAAKLAEFWIEMGFDSKTFPNETKEEIENLVKDVNYRVTDDDDCLVLCFITYGDHGQIYGKDGPVALQKVLNPLKTGHPDLREMIQFLKKVRIPFNRKLLAEDLIKNQNTKNAFTWLVQLLDDGITLVADIKTRVGSYDNINNYAERMKQNRIMKCILRSVESDWKQIDAQMKKLEEIRKILQEVKHTFEGSNDQKKVMEKLEDLTRLPDDPYQGILTSLDNVPLGGKPKIVILQTMLKHLEPDSDTEIEQTIPSEADFFYMWSRVRDGQSSFIQPFVEKMCSSLQEGQPEQEREITTIATRTIQEVERQLLNNQPDELKKNQELPFYMSQLRKKLYIPEYED